ncbi:hypothetical protein F4677DRAFT_402291 [Hypoxylon crocopeplum]|nr:hypothetical protein F4677DRAFT_402291 [Hypoxylon crocopeplum]
MAPNKVVLLLVCLVAAGSAYLVDPPTTAPSDTISDCSNWAVASSSDTCDSLAAQGYDVTQQQFLNYNPSLENGCHIVVGDSYCIEENFGIPPPTSTTSSTTSTSSTSTGNGVSTPSPIQTGMTSSCNAFYLVKLGDNCASIASAYGISLSDFYAWNPAAGSTCGYLGLNDYVCVGVIGQTITTTSTSGNGISTPTPIQTGMTMNCNKFYDVVLGDQCQTVADKFGITLDQFYSWNPAVGSSCLYLDVDDYVCVGVIGFTATTTSTTSTTTTSGNGVSTPTPTQPGMVSNCNKFHYTVSGDICQSIATAAGITLADFDAWNTGVGSDCGGLWLKTYCCIGVIS